MDEVNDLDLWEAVRTEHRYRITTVRGRRPVSAFPDASSTTSEERLRNLERAGVSRSVAMKLTGDLTESGYRRYAIVSESDLNEAVAKLRVIMSYPQRQRRA